MADSDYVYFYTAQDTASVMVCQPTFCGGMLED
jgi:hypothetical protein